MLKKWYYFVWNLIYLHSDRVKKLAFVLFPKVSCRIIVAMDYWEHHKLTEEGSVDQLINRAISYRK